MSTGEAWEKEKAKVILVDGESPVLQREDGEEFLLDLRGHVKRGELLQVLRFV